VSQNLEQILQAVQALSDADRMELRRRMEGREEEQENVTKQKAIRQSLIAKGILEDRPQRTKDKERLGKW